MGKHKLQKHHLYLGVGGMLAVTALVVALTFGLSSAQDMPPPGGNTPPPSGGDAGGGSYTPPSSGGTYVPPPAGTPPPGTYPYTPPNGGTQPPTTGTQYPTTGTQYPTTGTQYPTTGTQYPTTGTQYPTTGTTQPPTNMPACAAGQQPTSQVPCYMSGYQTPPTGTQYPTNMRQCGPNEQPTPQNPCVFNSTTSTTQPSYPATPSGQCWDSTNTTVFASQACTQARASANDRSSTTGIAGGVMSQTECANQRGTWQIGTNGAQSWCKFSDFNTATQTNTQQCGQGMHYAQGMGCVRDMTPEEIQGQNQKMPYQQDQGKYRPSGDQNQQGQQGQFGPQGQQGQFGQPGMNQQPMFQPPMYGIFGPQPMMGEQGQNGQKGPQNEEQMQKQQADQEAQFKKMQEQQVKQIKKQLSQMKKEIDRVRKQLDKVTVTDNTPEEIVTAKEALAEIDAAMAEVDTCSEDECFDIMPTVGPLMQDIMNPDVQNALQRLKEGPKFVKKLTTEVNRMVQKSTSAATSLSKKAKKIKDVDVRDEVIAEITTVAEQCSTLGAEVLDVAKGGDIETAADSLQNELGDACGGVEELTWKVEGFLNKQKSIKSMEGEVKSLKRQLAKFQKDAQRGKFNGDLDAVSSLAVVIPDVEALLAEIKTEKDIDMLGDLFDEAAGLISDAKDYILGAQVENMANQFDMFNTAPKGESVGESNPSPAP